MRYLPEEGPMLPPLILFYAAIDLDFAPADLVSAEFLLIRLPLYDLFTFCVDYIERPPPDSVPRVGPIS